MNKILTSKANLEQFENKSLLIVDDDDPFRNRLSKAMENKGFLVASASSVSEAIQKVKALPPTFAIIDLRLNDGSGLDVVKEIHKVKADSRIIVLTGYGNIPTAVAAVKSGAIDYLAKPADAEDLFLQRIGVSPENYLQKNCKPVLYFLGEHNIQDLPAEVL